MKKVLLALLCVYGGLQLARSEENRKNDTDTLRLHTLDEVVIVSSNKETNAAKALPSSVSVLSPSQIEGMKVMSVRDLSSVIPNFYIPDYGSKMTTPVYVRGVGERSTGQTIGLYVDNMPYLDKSTFDFEFMDIQRIEVLRGPQGTLYGRNAMGGIIHLYTNSPLDYQRTKITLTAGNYGMLRLNGTTSNKLSRNVGLSLSGYYDGNEGYTTNDFTKRKDDKLKSAGGRLRMDWDMTDQWTARLMANYDYADQGAYPYGSYDNGKPGNPNYNDPGKYTRQVVGANFNLNFTNPAILFQSTTGWQYLADEMRMDLDYTPLSMFTMHHKQYLNSWSEELTVKSNTDNNYQWSFGVYGFYNDLLTNMATTMGKDGIDMIMQQMFDQISANNPRAPKMTVLNDNIPMPGRFKTPTSGGAIFHQSTYNNLFTEGLSVTAGVRLDYEKTKLDYYNTVGMDLEVALPIPNVPPMTTRADTTLQGAESVSFTEILPKLALKYEFDDSNYLYFTVASGYKAGGFNIQMFSDLVQQALSEKYAPAEQPMNVRDAVSYDPEYSLNYELGWKGALVKDVLFGEISAFYIDVRDIQLTGFVNSGQGRMVINKGKAVSKGVDMSLSARLSDYVNVNANYGFTHATLQSKINDIDYSGKFIPYAPQHTLSLTAMYRKSFRDSFIDRINLQAQYNAAGKIYWNIENSISQKLYGTLNAKASIGKGIFDLALWTKNALNEDYSAFYFESLGKPLIQKGKPFRIGIDLSVSF
ncbi:MAG: TonB-dependent receptor [Tannerella sp.]|nr:TonB-dependent receptor [Tannerella sp.]